MNRHPKVLQELYAERERAVAALGDGEQIAAADLEGMDYLGRFRGANEHSGRRSSAARVLAATCDVETVQTILGPLVPGSQ